MAVVVGQLAVGAIADVVGRRRTIVGVMIFDAIMFGATGFSRDVTTILILRTLAGLAAPVALGDASPALRAPLAAASVPFKPNTVFTKAAR